MFVDLVPGSRVSVMRAPRGLLQPINTCINVVH